MAEPLSGHIDRHLEAETELGVKEGRDVFMVGKILNELLVADVEGYRLLGETHTGGIYYGEIISETVH